MTLSFSGYYSDSGENGILHEARSSGRQRTERSDRYRARFGVDAAIAAIATAKTALEPSSLRHRLETPVPSRPSTGWCGDFDRHRRPAGDSSGLEPMPRVSRCGGPTRAAPNSHTGWPRPSRGRLR